MQESPVIERARGDTSERRRRGQWLLIAGFVVLASLIAGLAYWAWAQQARSLRDQAERSVNAVAKLKAGQIAAWQEERHGDAELIRTNRLLAAAVADLLAGRDVAASTTRVRSYLGELPRYYEYADVILFAPDGRVIVRVPATATHAPGPRVRAMLAEAQRTRQVVSSDLYRGPDGAARIEMVAPLLAQRPAGPPVASVVLHIDPARFLYPFIQEWPLPNTTGETLLVERRGDRVLFLNELRFRKGTALKLSSPATDQTLPAAMAVRGRRGIVEGLDYRGVPVMAALAPVTGTDWYVVAKVDKSEVLDPISRRGWLTAGFTLVIVALGATGALLLWRLRERQVDADLVAGEVRFRSLFESMTEGVAMHELVRGEDAEPVDYRLVDTNPAFSSQTGLDRELVDDKLATVTYGTPDAPYLDVYAQVVASATPQRFESFFAPLDRHFEVSVVPQGDDRFATIFEDITERVTRERELRETRDYLENLLDYANAPVIVWDPERRITRFNHAFEELTQRSAKEVIGRHLELLFPDDERREAAVAHVTSATAGERWEVVEIPILRTDGEVRTVLWNSATIYDADGVTPIATIAQGQDITQRVKAERALRESEDRFKYVFDHSLIGKSITLPTGEISVNQAFCDMIGYTPEELRDRSWQDISHPDDLEETQRVIEELQSGVADSARFAKRYLKKDGSTVWADVITAVRRDEEGRPLYFITSALDITERKLAADELRDSEERLRFLIDQTPTVNWTLDRDLRFTMSRGGGLKTLGLEPDEVIGMYVGDYLGGPGPQADIGVAMHARALKGESFAYEQPLGELTFDISVGPLRDADDEIVGVIGVAYDSTARKRADEARREAELELAQLNIELEQRVADRTAELNAVNQELEAFAYSVSHDLRAPLRHISGFSMLLAEQSGDGLDEKSLHYIEVISSSVRQMGVLIDDLLQFSRTGRAELRIEPVDMQATLTEALEPLQREVDSRSIEWSVGDLPTVVADRALLRQVWANLIGNAIKYTRGTLTGEDRDRRGRRRRGVRLLRARQRRRLRHAVRAQALRRLPAPARRHRVRGDRHRPRQRQTHRHQTRRSSVGRGRARPRRHLLFLPARPKGADDVTERYPDILLAEDDANDLELTLEALAKHNLTNRVTVAHDGVEALEYLRREGAFSGREPGAPAVVLLDIKMPRKDGLEVLREIRGDPELKRLPVVILTSSREEQDLITSYDLGVNAYVVKPVDFRSFIDAVEHLGVFWALLNERPPLEH